MKFRVGHRYISLVAPTTDNRIIVHEDEVSTEMKQKLKQPEQWTNTRSFGRRILPGNATLTEHGHAVIYKTNYTVLYEDGTELHATEEKLM